MKTDVFNLYVLKKKKNLLKKMIYNIKKSNHLKNLTMVSLEVSNYQELQSYIDIPQYNKQLM